MADSARFTQDILDNFKCPDDKNEAYLKDTGQPGLIFRVRSSGHRSFEVRKKLHGKAKRVKIGNYPTTKIPDARIKARRELRLIDDGIDPTAKRKAEHAAGVTLRQCLEDYLRSNSNLKPATENSYRNTLDQYLKDWMEKPLRRITRDDVEQRHRSIGKQSETRANTTMRILRAVFNYAMAKYENELGDPMYLHNPVARLSHVKAWYPETRRKTYLNKQQLRAWFAAVRTLPDWNRDSRSDPETIRDYLITVLLTGLRRREAASLQWECIDMVEKTLTVSAVHTKNKKEHRLPIPDYLYEILRKRKSGIFVFPGRGMDKPIAEPKRMIAAIRARSGVHCTIHDLRRTFTTMAEEAGIRDYTLKRLLNHSDGRDVTAGYYVPDVEAIREPMNRVCEHILRVAMSES